MSDHSLDCLQLIVPFLNCGSSNWARSYNGTLNSMDWRRCITCLYAPVYTFGMVFCIFFTALCWLENSLKIIGLITGLNSLKVVMIHYELNFKVSFAILYLCELDYSHKYVSNDFCFPLFVGHFSNLFGVIIFPSVYLQSVPASYLPIS